MVNEAFGELLVAHRERQVLEHRGALQSFVVRSQGQKREVAVIVLPVAFDALEHADTANRRRGRNMETRVVPGH